MRPSCSSVTATVLNVDAAYAVDVDDCEVLDGIASDWAGVTVMTEEDLDAERLHRYIVEIFAVPLLPTIA